MSKNSKNNTSLIESYNKGYRVINEKIFYKNKKILFFDYQQLCVNKLAKFLANQYV